MARKLLASVVAPRDVATNLGVCTYPLPVDSSHQPPLAYSVARFLTEPRDEPGNYSARAVMKKVGKESRFQTWKWVPIMVRLGILLGAFGSY